MSGILLATLRTELRVHLGLEPTDTDSLSNNAADLLINRSFWNISDKYPFRMKEASATINTVIGTRRYEMPIPYEALRHIILEDPDTSSKQHTPLDRMSLVDYETKYANITDARGEPEKYLRYEDDYILYPTPDAVYNLTVHYWTIFDDLTDANDDPGDTVPRVWHEIILYGAIARGKLRFNAYTEFREFAAQQQVLIDNISPVEAKEETDSRHAGIVPDSRLFDI